MARSGPREPPKAEPCVASSEPAATIKASKPLAAVTKMQLQTEDTPTKRHAKKPTRDTTVDPDRNQNEMLSADLQVTVGENLHAARLSASLTLQQVAAQTGMTFQYVSKIEKGEKNLTLSTLHRLASVLRTDISALLRKTIA